MQWVVFEPNDRTLWSKVRRDAVSFLKGVWRSGALFGNTPEEAFYVKCDETLNTEDVRDRGQLIIEVGLAPVKPAEFVIFRLTQWAGANAESSS
jgi:phage tail sheath protein FI